MIKHLLFFLINELDFMIVILLLLTLFFFFGIRNIIKEKRDIEKRLRKYMIKIINNLSIIRFMQHVSRIFVDTHVYARTRAFREDRCV